MAEPIRNSQSSTRYPEPSPGPVEVSSQTFDVGAGSEVPPTSIDRARVAAERVRDNFQDVASQARQHLNDLTDRASVLANEASQRFNEVREHINERLPEWKQEAGERVEDARRRAVRSARQIDRSARSRPLQAISIAAIAGFLLGVSLRIWRASRG